MAGNNNIGTGAVVLTANADQLLGGLNKAQVATEKWAGTTAKKAAKAADAGGGGKGGLLGAVMGGGVAGIAAGAAMKGMEMLFKLPEHMRDLKESSGQGDGGPIDRMLAAMERVHDVGANLLATVISPLAPGFELAASYAEKLGERLQPILAVVGGRLGGLFMTLVDVGGTFLDTLLKGFEAVWPIINKVSEAFEAYVFVLGEGAKLILEGLGQIYDWLGRLIGKAVDFGFQGKTGSQMFFDGLRVVGKAAGYVFDVMQRGAGVVAVALGGIVEYGLAPVIKAFSDVIALAKGLPDALRPAWIDDLTTALDKAAASTAGVGKAMGEWGADKMATVIGASAAAIGAGIDKLQAKFDARAKLIGDSAHKKGDKPELFGLAGAHLMGSQQAYSTVEQWKNLQRQAEQWEKGGVVEDNKDPVAIAKKGVEEQKKTNKILDKALGYPFTGTLVTLKVADS